jgi:hypothetical protein
MVNCPNKGIDGISHDDSATPASYLFPVDHKSCGGGGEAVCRPVFHGWPTNHHTIRAVIGNDARPADSVELVEVGVDNI